jgi:predicted metalloprotease
MRWTPGGMSGDVDDERDNSGGGGGLGFGGFGPHLGIGGTLILLILSLVFRTNLFRMFSGAPAASTRSAYHQPASPEENRQAQFVSFVLDDVQKTWDRVLPQQAGVAYHHARLVLYRDSWPSGCGTAQTATGPFYCPADEKVYLDLGFFDELRERFGAPGEFAEAYVVAHEIGHHVQKLLGIEGKVHRLQQREPEEANPLSVRLELQADCLAGVWANSSEQRDIVEQADIPAGLRAAAAVGDDRLQRMATGRVSPETFTHGSSAQRVHWFSRGVESGRTAGCNTFSRAAAE